MRTLSFFAFAIIAALLFQTAILAMETDQYNLPPVPLGDIGDEVSQFVEDNLWTAAANINAEIERREACLNGTAAKDALCRSPGSEQEKIAELRSNDALARAVYKLLGDGTIFTTHAGDWLTTHDFAATPARYKADYSESIYVTMPINYATLSPTVRMNGVEFGTDKIDHFFQQGYKYYRLYSAQLKKGRTPEQALKKAVSWGKMTEKTYFGLWVAGVYSNADLYANYAGMKFYLGLTQPVEIGAQTRPAVFTVVDGKWQAGGGEAARDELLKPFVNDQMNEALNPSVYSFIVYPVVRDVVRKQSCGKWKTAFPALTRAEFAERSRELELWNGEDYGFTRKNKMVTIADTCFDKDS